MKEMMTALEYLKEKARMADNCTTRCIDCPLGCSANETDTFSMCLERKHPEQSIAIVKKWSDEHPRKTILQDFREKYPHAEMHDGYPISICPYNLGYLKSRSAECIRLGGCTRQGYKVCWSQPLTDK